MRPSGALRNPSSSDAHHERSNVREKTHGFQENGVEPGCPAGRDTASPLVLGADDTVNARASRFIPPELTESDLTPRLRLLLARLESLERLLGREDAPKGLEDRVVRLAHRIRNEMSVVLFARHAGRVPSRCVR
jgi:hypothetical protein